MFFTYSPCLVPFYQKEKADKNQHARAFFPGMFPKGIIIVVV